MTEYKDWREAPENIQNKIKDMVRGKIVHSDLDMGTIVRIIKNLEIQHPQILMSCFPSETMDYALIDTQDDRHYRISHKEIEELRNGK